MIIKKDRNLEYLVVGLCILLVVSICFNFGNSASNITKSEHLGAMTYSLPEGGEWFAANLSNNDASYGIGGKTGRVLRKSYIDASTLSQVVVGYNVFAISLDDKNIVSWDDQYGQMPVGLEGFQMAVNDDLIRKNPFGFQLATVLVNDAVTREAITRKQERTFLEFVRNDPHYSRYYDGMYILFKTGMRISEFTGLTLSDLDMEKRTISINHQLQKTGTLVYIESTKTDAGTRVIPMQDDVYECFERIITGRPKLKVEPVIDGYSGFLHFDKDGKPMVAMHWEKYFQHAVQKYNSIYRVQLPKITPHVCRHTYCSNMAKSGMNPKVLQYLMGHSDISVTLNVYTHMKLDDALEEMEKLSRKQSAAEKEIRKAGSKGDGRISRKSG